MTQKHGQPENPRWYLSSGFAWATGTVILTGLLLIPVMRLWRAEIYIPFRYGGGDAAFFLMAIKSVLKHGWFLENPDLGAPSGQELYDFPVFAGDGFHFLVIKLLGLLSSDPAFVLNLYFLLSFPLVALASFLVLRQLGTSGGAALVCSVLYALAPYHFLRGEGQLFLAAYYSVPVGAYLVLSILSSKPLFTRRTSLRPRLLAWASKRSLVTLALCLLVASAGSIYYAVFTCMLLVAATALILVARRDVQTLIQSSVIMGVILGFLALNSLPNLMYSFANGPNGAITRTWVDSETYSLNLIKMILPRPGHYIDTLGNLAAGYYQETVIQGEGFNQSLGFIATLGFVWLLIVALAGCLSPRWEIGDLRHRQLATATVIAFLIGTTGGLSTLFAYLISPQIRSWNRISIFIAFLAIAAIALLLDALQERIRLRRGRRILVGTLLLSVLLIGLYDQSSDTLVENGSGAKEAYRDDAAFVRAIDDEMPPRAQIFQLPYMPFPEGHRKNMFSYDLLRPYLHESDLRWSFGAVKGRPAADWQDDLTDENPEKLLSEVSAVGFDGIYIDRSGYPDRAAKLERRLSKLLDVEPLVSSSENMSFFSLLPYKEDLQGHTPLKRSRN